ncbi:endonuclease [Arthrobacter phage vB_ArS-ArV2]|uniref:GIY-YIG domain-containing protein n=1 Tax=Arthrobacter phage vB_ArS-ArV2 TaxID=1414742 RepID=V5R925_9CAUD|nr:endonuclease [Arthrobacter phage vB_ArS-ArV2]AHB31668.1 hypothetical protein ArV2_gp58 [Arthrobacter phage vB_ArS-ArV2]
MSRGWQRSLPHDVYEIMNAAGQVLYVGLSMNTERRLLQHRSKPWFAKAVDVRIATYPDLDTAKRAEGLRISEVNPPHNAQREIWAAARGIAQPPNALSRRQEVITHGR